MRYRIDLWHIETFARMPVMLVMLFLPALVLKAFLRPFSAAIAPAPNDNHPFTGSETEQTIAYAPCQTLLELVAEGFW